MIIPNLLKNKKKVPNHQPDIYCLHNKPKRRRHFVQRPGTYPRHWRIPGTALAGLVPPPSSPAVGPDQLAFSGVPLPALLHKEICLDIIIQNYVDVSFRKGENCHKNYACYGCSSVVLVEKTYSSGIAPCFT